MPVAGMQSPLKVEQRDPRDPMDHLRQRAQKEAWYLRPEVLAHPAPELLWPGNRSAEHQGYAQPKRASGTSGTGIPLAWTRHAS
jgi:hypothetical protein